MSCKRADLGLRELSVGAAKRKLRCLDEGAKSQGGARGGSPRNLFPTERGSSTVGIQFDISPIIRNS